MWLESCERGSKGTRWSRDGESIRFRANFHGKSLKGLKTNDMSRLIFKNRDFCVRKKLDGSKNRR